MSVGFPSCLQTLNKSNHRLLQIEHPDNPIHPEGIGRDSPVFRREDGWLLSANEQDR